MANTISDAARRLLNNIKEFWFLIALVLSGASIVVYMFVFDVTPWDVHADTRNRRAQTEHHTDVGFDLLERGEYGRAKTEFERALALIATNDAAISGRYLSEMFLDLQSPDWNAAVGLSLEKRFAGRLLANDALQERRHIADKYLGDLHWAVLNAPEARQHYENALKRKANYLDALKGYYELVYENPRDLSLLEKERLQQLIDLAERMIKADPHDYRGLHALGYALFEQAIATSDEDERSELLNRAEEQSRKASVLKGNNFVVVSDFGEIVRPTDPVLAVTFHKLAGSLNDRDPISGSWIKKLHISGDTIWLDTQNEMKALVAFELALDYLAMHRQRGRKADLSMHQQFMADANKLDVEREAVRVYEDGLEVLDMLLPAETARR